MRYQENSIGYWRLAKKSLKLLRHNVVYINKNKNVCQLYAIIKVVRQSITAQRERNHGGSSPFK